MEFIPGARSVIELVGPANAPGCGDGGLVPNTLGVPQRPQRPRYDTTRLPRDRPPPGQASTAVCFSCGVLSRQHEWWRPDPRNDLSTDQELPAGRTPFRVHVASLGTDRLPIERDRDDRGRLAHLRPAARQGLCMGMMVQPIVAYHTCLWGWDMQEPPLEKVLRG